MRLIDYLKRRWLRKTPRVIKAEPGMLTIEARGCRIFIGENGIDKRGRANTIIDVDASALRDEFQLTTNPAAAHKSRTYAAIHVVKLKAPRKPKQAKAEDIEGKEAP